MSDNQLPQLVEDRLSDWLRRSRQWYVIYYTLGALAVVLTITVASRPHFLPKDSDWLPTLAWLAAIFQGLSTFVIALPRASAYRAAWRLLWLARAEYVDTDKTDDDGILVRNAIARGWTLIDWGYTDAFRTTGRTTPSARNSQQGKPK